MTEQKTNFFSVFWFFDKHCNWQLKNFRICATATDGQVFCSWAQFGFSHFFSPVCWTWKHYFEQNDFNCSYLTVQLHLKCNTGQHHRAPLHLPISQHLQSPYMAAHIASMLTRMILFCSSRLFQLMGHHFACPCQSISYDWWSPIHKTSSSGIRTKSSVNWPVRLRNRCQGSWWWGYLLGSCPKDLGELLWPEQFSYFVM